MVYVYLVQNMLAKDYNANGALPIKQLWEPVSNALSEDPWHQLHYTGKYRKTLRRQVGECIKVWFDSESSNSQVCAGIQCKFTLSLYISHLWASLSCTHFILLSWVFIHFINIRVYMHTNTSLRGQTRFIFFLPPIPPPIPLPILLLFLPLISIITSY